MSDRSTSLILSKELMIQLLGSAKPASEIEEEYDLDLDNVEGDSQNVIAGGSLVNNPTLSISNLNVPERYVPPKKEVVGLENIFENYNLHSSVEESIIDVVNFYSSTNEEIIAVIENYHLEDVIYPMDDMTEIIVGNFYEQKNKYLEEVDSLEIIDDKYLSEVKLKFRPIEGIAMWPEKELMMNKLNNTVNYHLLKQVPKNVAQLYLDYNKIIKQLNCEFIIPELEGIKKISEIAVEKELFFPYGDNKGFFDYKVNMIRAFDSREQLKLEEIATEENRDYLYQSEKIKNYKDRREAIIIFEKELERKIEKLEDLENNYLRLKLLNGSNMKIYMKNSYERYGIKTKIFFVDEPLEKNILHNEVIDVYNSKPDYLVRRLKNDYILNSDFLSELTPQKTANSFVEAVRLR